MDAEFKTILCELAPVDVRSSLAFELPAHGHSGLKPKPVRDQIYRDLLEIIDMMAPSHIWWLPAGIITARDYFSQGLHGYLFADDAFPVLACVNFKENGSGIIGSRGLEWFCGQELEFHPGHLAPRESMRRIARLAHHMITQGPILLDRVIDGLEDGERYRLSVDPDEPKVTMTQIDLRAPIKLN